LFNGGTPEPLTEQALKAWTRIDADRSQVLSNGALVRWKIGRMWNVREALASGATLGSMTLGFMKSTLRRVNSIRQGSRTHMVIARMTTAPYEHLDVALARVHKLDLGEVRRHAIADAAIAWTEQPGSRTPFVGAVQRGTGYFFVSISALEA
jgi:hypothetical protein